MEPDHQSTVSSLQHSLEVEAQVVLFQIFQAGLTDCVRDGEFLPSGNCTRRVHLCTRYCNVPQVLRAAVVRSETGDVEVPPTEAKDTCPFCGSVVEVSYGNELLNVRCTGCPEEHVSEILAGGSLKNSPIFPPTGIEGRPGQELWEALFHHVASAVLGFLRGVCPVCTALPTTSIEVCHNHVMVGICEECRSTQAGMVTVQCEPCTFAWNGPAWIRATTHPAVSAFFDDQGIEADGGLTLDVYRELLTSRQRIRSTDPVTLEVTVAIDDIELIVTIDGNLRVIEVKTVRIRTDQ